MPERKFLFQWPLYLLGDQETLPAEPGDPLPRYLEGIDFFTFDFSNHQDFECGPALLVFTDSDLASEYAEPLARQHSADPGNHPKPAIIEVVHPEPFSVTLVRQMFAGIADVMIDPTHDARKSQNHTKAKMLLGSLLPG